MFVVIAKNASTTLKRLVHSLDYPEHEPLTGTEAIHEFFGYSFDNQARVPLTASSKSCASGYTTFAVYRDPVERFLSIYYDKVSPTRSPDKSLRGYFSTNGLIDADMETFIRFTEQELQKDSPLLQDEHLRRQSSFYDPSSVDLIVPLEKLDSFLIEHLNIDTGRHFNKSGHTTTLPRKQRDMLITLYKDDYKLLDAENLYCPEPA